MKYLPNIKILDTDDFEIYSNKIYSDDFILRMSNYIYKKKRIILDFFNTKDFRKVRINLFDNKEDYYIFSKQYINISPYSTGNCCAGMINYICRDEDLAKFQKAGFIIASIVHEFVHLIYHEQISNNHCVWFEEGLAQYLSGQKSFLETDNTTYTDWLMKCIFNKELPPIEFLKEHGSIYGKFCDCNTNKYNGYDISYALIRFMLEKYTRTEILQLAKHITNLHGIEKNLLDNFKNKYKNLLL